VPLVDPETAQGEAGAILQGLARHGADVHPLLRAVAHSSGCYRNFLRLPDSLIRFSKLDGRYREILVMRLANVLDSEYEWELHVRYALAAGLTQAQLDALKRGDIDGGAFDETERLIIEFTDQGLKQTISDELFAKVRDRIGDEGVVDLVLCLGWWAGLVPFVNAALDIHLDDT
jgi:alkylhydroperoxidase family enzyme